MITQKRCDRYATKTRGSVRIVHVWQIIGFLRRFPSGLLSWRRDVLKRSKSKLVRPSNKSTIPLVTRGRCHIFSCDLNTLHHPRSYSSSWMACTTHTNNKLIKQEERKRRKKKKRFSSKFLKKEKDILSCCLLFTC